MEEYGVDLDNIVDYNKTNKVTDVGAKHYLTALLFSGLNKDKFRELISGAHINHIMGSRPMPKTYLREGALDGGGIPPGDDGGQTGRGHRQPRPTETYQFLTISVLGN